MSGMRVLAAGRSGVRRPQRVSSQRLQTATGWEQAIPDPREGWRRVAGALPA